MAKREIRGLDSTELPAALDLIWNVFAEDVATDCTQEGVDNFWEKVDYEYVLHRTGDGTLRFWGAFEEDKLLGVCAIRELERIEFLYVDSGRQREGIGTALLKKAALDCKELDEGIGTLQAAVVLSAEPFFAQCGFERLAEPQADEGIPTVWMRVLGKVEWPQ